MSSLKRKVTYDSSRPRKRARPGYAKTAMVRYKQPSTFNRTIIATVMEYDTNLSADIQLGFGFSPTNLWVQGSSGSAYPTSVSGIWDLVRVHKVEVTVQCDRNSMEFNSSATQQIPWCLDAFDPNSGVASFASIKQNSTCQTFLIDKQRKRTIYPNLLQSSGVVDVGRNRKNMFVGAGQDQPWYGYHFVADTQMAQATVGIRFIFKIYLECRGSI